jgi:iron complex transport system substrate-binding protein
VGGISSALEESRRSFCFASMRLNGPCKLRTGRAPSPIGLKFFLCFAAALSLGLAKAPGRVVIDETGRRVNIPDNARRVVSLAPSITETIYALGLEDRLVGDTDYCDYPPEAKQKPHVGAVINPNLERIVALKPDLVVGSAEANRRETVDQLDHLGIPLYGLKAQDLDTALKSIDDLGMVLGGEPAARAVLERLRARIKTVEGRVQGQPKPKVLFVVWYRPLITAGPQTFIADVIRHAGGISMGDDLKGEWPHLSVEEVLHRNPEVILFPKSESFSPSLQEFQRLPGWKEFKAVKNQKMYFISDAIMRPSPRLVDALEEVASILHPRPGSRPQ